MNNNYPAVTSSNIKAASEEHYIIFSIKEKKYALNIKNVIEVINIPVIEIPEIMPEGITGIFNYKGTMTKVIDLCPFLGFEPSPFNINNQLIVMNANGIFYAIHTENIINIEHIENNNLQEIPYNIEASILQSIYKTESETINIINYEQLNNIIANNTKPGKINYLELFPQDEKSKNILQLREYQNNIKPENFSFNFNLNTQNQYVLFTLDNHNYYMDLKYVKEFSSTKRLKITKLPYTPDYINGIVNIKGEFLVVIDLQIFLNSKKENENKSKNSKLIVIEGKNYNLAFIVDEIKYIQNLNNIKPTEYNNDISKYIYAEFIQDDKLYGIINTEKIINDERLYIDIE